MRTLEQHTAYLFVFAHPDDEVYTAGLMHRLLAAGKAVTAAYITNGDAGDNPENRAAELARSMDVIGVAADDAVNLGFSEARTLGSLRAISVALGSVIEKVRPTCVVGMDYEGGHVMHDSASFVTAQMVGKHGLPHYVFPVYHIKDSQRKAALFRSGLVATDVIDLTPEEAGVKVGVLEAHAGQADHFARLQQHDPTYLERLKTQETYRRIDGPADFDFSQPPAVELGYARSGLTFEDFASATRAYFLEK